MIEILPSFLLFLGLIAGQVFKLPLGQASGLTLLDLVVVFLDILALVQLRFKLKSPPLWIITALIFSLIAIISLIFSPLKLTFPETVFSFAYTLRFLAFILLGWVIFSGAFPTLKTSSVLISSGVVLAILGLLQLIFLPNLSFLTTQGWDPHYLRTVSTLLDPNFLGAFLVLTLLLIQGNSYLKSKMKKIAFLITYLALITTFSRSSAIMLGVSFFTLAILQRSWRTGLLAVILTVGFIFSLIFYNQTIAQSRNINRQQSAEYRVSSWKQGRQLFESHPFLGVGFNSYRYALQQYHLASDSFIQSRGGSGNDSSLLFIASTTGILGLLSYGLFLLSLIYLAFKNYQNKNNWGLILLSALPGLLAHSLFVNSLFYPWILVWVTVAVAQLDSRL
ncbi:MAG: O-antigen ligase family protein [bacterium]|nr:O-antigen ligase family protein [bacterium]